MALVTGARRSLFLAQEARCFSSSPAVRAAAQKAPIQLYGLEGRYAHALFSAAASKNCLKEVEDDLDKLNVAAGGVFADFVMNPSSARNARLRTIEEALVSVKCNDVTRGFFRTVTEKNRGRRIVGMIRAYKELMTAFRGEVACTVTTATQPDAKTLDQIKKVLSGLVKPNEKVIMDVKVKPEIIGGMIVEVGDRYCDMSVSKKVRSLTESLRGAI